MDALQALHRRFSVHPRHLQTPVPDAQQLELMLQAALTAPDHGWLRPWRFLVIEGEARQRLGDLFAEALLQKGIDKPAELNRQREKPQRAPMTLVIVARVQPDSKIPEIEQLLAAAAAAEHMQLAAQALGFASMWTTGGNAYEPHVAAGLGLGEHERILGFLNVGTPASAQEPPARPRPNGLLLRWEQPGVVRELSAEG